LNISNAAFGKGLEAALNNYSVPCPSPDDIHTYVDGILISSVSFEKHLNTLEWIFHKISQAGLTLKFKNVTSINNKSNFSEITYPQKV